MDDLIRRSDAIKAMAKAVGHIVYDAEAVSQHVMNSIPAVEPKQEWIPCEERLPEEMGIYLCTVGAPYRNPREMYYAPQAWADKSDNATWRSIDGSYVFDWFVEAWQPLPEPYMKGADDETD